CFSYGPGQLAPLRTSSCRRWLTKKESLLRKFQDCEGPLKYQVKLFLKRNVILSLVLIGWFVTICAGMRSILIYEGTAGTSGASPLEWPADSRIQRRQGMPALVLMIHPHCPCGRATMSELAQLMVRGQARVDVFVLFVKPD